MYEVLVDGIYINIYMINVFYEKMMNNEMIRMIRNQFESSAQHKN